MLKLDEVCWLDYRLAKSCYGWMTMAQLLAGWLEGLGSWMAGWMAGWLETLPTETWLAETGGGGGK